MLNGYQLQKQLTEVHIQGRPFNSFRKPQRQIGPRMNDRIRVPEVRVISSTGDQLGVMSPQAAIRLAEEESLDLVEISPTAKPPVCKIMDYGKFRYEQQKKEQEGRKKQTKVTVKEIKMRPNTDQHDIEFKMNHVRRFIEQKDKAKVTIQFRGREIVHIDRSKDILNKFVESLKDVAVAEAPPKLEGRTLSVILMPK